VYFVVKIVLTTKPRNDTKQHETTGVIGGVGASRRDRCFSPEVTWSSVGVGGVGDPRSSLQRASPDVQNGAVQRESPAQKSGAGCAVWLAMFLNTPAMSGFLADLVRLCDNFRFQPRPLVPLRPVSPAKPAARLSPSQLSDYGALWSARRRAGWSRTLAGRSSRTAAGCRRGR